MEDLTTHSLKKFKQTVSSVEKGNECGISLNGLKDGIKLEQGDVIECYREADALPNKFNSKAGLISSY
jgi:translation initiation factor IF-2